MVWYVITEIKREKIRMSLMWAFLTVQYSIYVRYFPSLIIQFVDSMAVFPFFDRKTSTKLGSNIVQGQNSGKKSCFPSLDVITRIFNSTHYQYEWVHAFEMCEHKSMTNNLWMDFNSKNHTNHSIHVHHKRQRIIVSFVTVCNFALAR